IPLAETTSFSLDTTLLPSGPGQKLRVMATDGFNTSYSTHNVSISNPLVVSSVEPADTSTGVDADTPITMVFGTPINASTLFSGFKMVKQGDPSGLGGTMTYDPAVQTAVFQPDSTLLNNTAYVVTLTGVQDVNGNALPAPFSWSFTIGP